MKYAIEYTITGDNSGTGTYITDNVAEFVPRMRKEYAGRITFSITQLTNPDGEPTSSADPAGEDHRRGA